MSADRRRRRDEAGYVAVVVALLASAVFIGLAALGVDTARWYVEAERVQKAADAAALAGVTYMPTALDKATVAAKASAAKNGFNVVTSPSTVRITTAVGSKPSELTVTIASKVHNAFGTGLGMSSSWITRSATADYTAPTPMGSPCPTFGNEPRGATGSSAPTAGSTGTALAASSFSNCPKDGTTGTSHPQFWGSIEGPATDKFQGDRYSTNTCTEASTVITSPVYGCAADKKNTEYHEDGTYFTVQVRPEAVGTPVKVQIYDPAFVNTSSYCSGDTAANAYVNAGFLVVPKSSAVADNMNPFSPTGSKARYGAWKVSGTNPAADYTGSDVNTGAGEYCTGDSFPSYNRTPCYYPTRYRSTPCFGVPVTTSFALHLPTDTDDPTRATPIAGCIKQFRGFATPPQVNELKDTADAYNGNLAQVYHQWVELCSFTPAKPGNYFLQVRTNVPLGGTPSTITSSKPAMIYSGNSAVTDGAGTSTDGAGSNSFALRAVVDNNSMRGYVAVSGWQRMPLLQNAPQSTATFNLVRALPNAKGQYLVFDFFDAADGATSGTVTVLAPADATGSVKAASGVPGCSAGFNDAAYSTYTALTGCKQNVSGATTDGQVVHMVIPIPSDYTCDDTTLAGCWFQVQMSYSGNVTDFTTWSASIGGDPVRLVQ